MIYISYWMEEGDEPFATRTRDFVPRIGEEVRIKNKEYVVLRVIWEEADVRRPEATVVVRERGVVV